MARSLPIVGVTSFLAASVTCVILIVAFAPLNVHEVALFNVRNSKRLQSLERIAPTLNTAHALNSQRWLRDHQGQYQSLEDEAEAPEEEVVRDPRYPAVMYGEAEAIKELDELRNNATNAMSNLPDGASPIIKALAVQDYDEVMRLLDEVANTAKSNIHAKAPSSKLLSSRASSSRTPLDQALSQALADLEEWHATKGASSRDKAEHILSAMSRTRNALAELVSTPALLTGLETQADLAASDAAIVAHQDRAYEAIKTHIPGGAAALDGAVEATAVDVALPVHADGRDGIWFEAPAENVDRTAYVVNQPITTFVTDGRLPYEALPQTVESSA